MRRLLKSGYRSGKSADDVELKKKIEKEVKNRQDDVAYLKNRVAIEENVRKAAQEILVKIVQCKANQELIVSLQKKVDVLEKKVDEMGKTIASLQAALKKDK